MGELVDSVEARMVASNGVQAIPELRLYLLFDLRDAQLVGAVLDEVRAVGLLRRFQDVFVRG